MADATLTIIGNTVGPAEVRFTSSGHAVANVTVVHTPRRFNKQSNQWEDQEPVFMDCTAWREMAENMAESLTEKGMRVFVTGQLKADTWQDKQTGQKRTKVVLDVHEIGPSLRWATAQVNRTPKQGGHQQGQNQWPQSAQPNQHAGTSGAWGGQPVGQQGDTPPPF